jgi:hypothetical protein
MNVYPQNFTLAIASSNCSSISSQTLKKGHTEAVGTTKYCKVFGNLICRTVVSSHVPQISPVGQLRKAATYFYYLHTNTNVTGPFTRVFFRVKVLAPVEGTLQNLTLRTFLNTRSCSLGIM